MCNWILVRRMASSGMLRRVDLVRTDVSEELSASFISVRRIGELGTTLAVRSVRRLLVTASVVRSSPILVTLMREALSSSETSALTRATRLNIPEDAILHSHRRENLKSYMDCGTFYLPTGNSGWCFLFSLLQTYTYTTRFGPTGHLQVYNLVCTSFQKAATVAEFFHRLGLCRRVDHKTRRIESRKHEHTSTAARRNRRENSTTQNGK
jgi:hypothetical protein